MPSISFINEPMMKDGIFSAEDPDNPGTQMVVISVLKPSNEDPVFIFSDMNDWVRKKMSHSREPNAEGHYWYACEYHGVAPGTYIYNVRDDHDTIYHTQSTKLLPKGQVGNLITVKPNGVSNTFSYCRDDFVEPRFPSVDKDLDAHGGIFLPAEDTVDRDDDSINELERSPTFQYEIGLQASTSEAPLLPHEGEARHASERDLTFNFAKPGRLSDPLLETVHEEVNALDLSTYVNNGGNMQHP